VQNVLSPVQVTLGFDVHNLGYSERADNVSFAMDAQTGYLSLVNRTDSAAVKLLSVIGTVGRSPWIEIEREMSSDSFWVTMSIGAFALSRCRL
jgi:hypothetical protein